jgi:hypothetical protein
VRRRARAGQARRARTPDDAIANAAGYGCRRSHSRFLFGMRLHTALGPDGTPRALRLVAADRPECEVALDLLPSTLRGGETAARNQSSSRSHA